MYEEVKNALNGIGAALKALDQRVAKNEAAIKRNTVRQDDTEVDVAQVSADHRNLRDTVIRFQRAHGMPIKDCAGEHGLSVGRISQITKERPNAKITSVSNGEVDN